MLQPPIQTHHKTCINNDVHTIYLFIYVLFPNHIFSQIDCYNYRYFIFDWPELLVFAQNLPKMLLGNP